MDTDKAESPPASPDSPPAPTEEYTYQDNFYTPANSEFYKSNPYSHLDQSKHEIRLLELCPVQDGKPLEASLRTINLDSLETENDNNYTAISYAAGSYEETEVIYVNGIRFNAFANLARALRQAARAMEKEQLQGYPRLIWADQICINQSNLNERSHQVNFMRGIYQSAAIVLACLGDDPSNGRCVEAINRMKDWYNLHMDVGKTKIYSGDQVVADIGDEQFHTDWDTMHDIFRCNWWRRGWVYQEVVVAREVFLLFGEFIVDWATVSKALSFLTGITYLIVREGNIGDGAMNYWHVHQNTVSNCAEAMNHGRQVPIRKSISSLLETSQRYDFSDMRDRIFAFVGLVDPGYNIIPDYTISPKDLLFLCCSKIIRFEQKLNILACCQSSSGRSKRRSDLPSWIPDWITNIHPYDNFFFVLSPTKLRMYFHASKEFPPAATFVRDSTDGYSVLRVQCLFIDNVATKISLGPREHFYSFETPRIDSWARNVAPRDDEKDHRYMEHSPKTIGEAFDSMLYRGMGDYGARNSSGMEAISLVTRLGQCFRSPKGYLGVTKCSPDVQHTDQICVLIGADIPFILRKVDEHYVLVSDAYVEGLMYGEAIDMMEQGKLEMVTIDIH